MAVSTEIVGTVWGVFAHRFAVETDDGKVLADVGRGAFLASRLREGERITVRGDRKPSEIKAREVVTAHGAVYVISWPDKHERDDGDPAAALEAVRADGYAVVGEARRKPKHWEIAATRGGQSVVLHVDLNARIRKIRDAHGS